MRVHTVECLVKRKKKKQKRERDQERKEFGTHQYNRVGHRCQKKAHGSTSSTAAFITQQSSINWRIYKTWI